MSENKDEKIVKMKLVEAEETPVPEEQAEKSSEEEQTDTSEEKVQVKAKKLPFRPHTQEEVEERGYSLFNINVRVVKHRPLDMGKDVDVFFNGLPIQGIGQLLLSGCPPHVHLMISDGQKFGGSINRAGWFFQQGVFISQLLQGASYPAIKCVECEPGHLRVENGGYCDNPDCVNANLDVKAKVEAMQEEYLKTQNEAKENEGGDVPQSQEETPEEPVPSQEEE